MAARSPFGALDNYARPHRDALGCVTQHRLLHQERQRIGVDTVSSLALNNLRPVLLKGPYSLSLRVGLECRVVHVEGVPPARSGYVAVPHAYLYQFLVLDGREVLSFHWTPESSDPHAVRFPHAHIGPAITAGQTVLRPGDLHRAHIPTGHVWLPAVIRLAIGEFGVVPLRDDWDARLAWCEAMLTGEARS